MKHGIEYIPKEKDIYRWSLENNFVDNYQLLGAYEDSAMSRLVGTTPGYRAGANRTEFYMLFANKPYCVLKYVCVSKPCDLLTQLINKLYDVLKPCLSYLKHVCFMITTITYVV